LGEKFTLYLNGEKQNSTPQSNVKISGLTGEFYQARVDFEDAALADFANGNFAVQKGIEATYVIKKNKKGEYVMRFHSQAEIGGATATSTPAVDQETRRIAAVDDDSPKETPETVTLNTNVSGVESGANATTTVTQTTTTKTAPAAKPKSGESVNVGMNVGGVNMGINVNVTEEGMGMGMGVDETHSVTTTTTTTKTTTTATQQPVAKPKPVATPQPVAEPAPVVMSTGRCATSMSASSFASAKSNIESKSFEDTKLTVAKQVTKANCMTAAQIRDVMKLFSFEETKLDYAKFAYDFCYNQGDYYEVNDAFTFESSIEELNTFLESK
jgi:hypothetical protein